MISDTEQPVGSTPSVSEPARMTERDVRYLREIIRFREEARQTGTHTAEFDVDAPLERIAANIEAQSSGSHRLVAVEEIKQLAEAVIGIGGEDKEDWSRLDFANKTLRGWLASSDSVTPDTPQEQP
jgi:hypothetical protein